MAKGHFENRIVNGSSDEIGQLAQSFNHMANELYKVRQGLIYSLKGCMLLSIV